MRSEINSVVFYCFLLFVIQMQIASPIPKTQRVSKILKQSQS